MLRNTIACNFFGRCIYSFKLHVKLLDYWITRLLRTLLCFDFKYLKIVKSTFSSTKKFTYVIQNVSFSYMNFFM